MCTTLSVDAKELQHSLISVEHIFNQVLPSFLRSVNADTIPEAARASIQIVSYSSEIDDTQTCTVTDEVN